MGNAAAAPGGGAAGVGVDVRGGVGGNADAADRAPGARRMGAAGIMICGDDDQSIYSFRGASPESLFSFNRDYPNVKNFYLETNYRSRGEIVEAAGRLIEHNNKRFRKSIRPGKKERSIGSTNIACR